MAEKELLAKIKSRGYWHLEVRPPTFEEHRLDRTELFAIVDQSRVSLRGWDFPHVDNDAPPSIEVEWVGQATEWEHNLQVWRIYRSAQVVVITGIPYDWRDQSGWWPAQDGWQSNSCLGVMEVIAKLTEIMEFVARLSQTRAGDQTMVLSLTLGMMRGRQLFVDSPRRASLWQGYRASVQDIPLKRVMSRVELVARARPLAIDLSEEVFSFFGWRPAAQIAVDIQNEFLAGR